MKSYQKNILSLLMLLSLAAKLNGQLLIQSIKEKIETLDSLSKKIDGNKAMKEKKIVGAMGELKQFEGFAYLDAEKKVVKLSIKFTESQNEIAIYSLNDNVAVIKENTEYYYNILHKYYTHDGNLVSAEHFNNRFGKYQEIFEMYKNSSSSIQSFLQRLI